MTDSAPTDSAPTGTAPTGPAPTGPAAARRTRRWLDAVIAATADAAALPALPFRRGSRRRPAAVAVPGRDGSDPAGGRPAPLAAL